MCISDINENLGRQTLSELSETFGEDRVEFVGCDVTKEDSVEKLIKQAEEVFKSKLYCFINNAGKLAKSNSLLGNCLLSTNITSFIALGLKPLHQLI